MKGITLASGGGTMLYLTAKVLAKQLIPVYAIPMICSFLSVLMLAGISDILIISTPGKNESFKGLLCDGPEWGIHLSYVKKPSSDGLAQAYIIR